MSNLWLKALTLVAVVCLAACDDDSCAEKVDKFAQCIDEVRKDKDIQELINKKLDIFKGCGAKDATVKCIKTKIDCASKAQDTAASSPQKKEAVDDAEECFEKKNLWEGMEQLFHGLNYFGHMPDHHGGLPPPPFDPSMIHNGMPPPPPPPGIPGGKEGHGPDIGVVGGGDGPPPPPGPFGGDGPPPPPGAVNSPMMPNPFQHHHQGPPVFFLPDECNLANEAESVEECTMEKLFNKTEIVKLINTMKDKLKNCKKAMPEDCKVRPEMLPCLLDVFKPTIKVAMDTYKDCMSSAGYKLPEPPPLPPMPGMPGMPPMPSSGNSVAGPTDSKNATVAGESKKSGEAKDKKSSGESKDKKSGEKSKDKKSGEKSESKNSTSTD